MYKCIRRVHIPCDLSDLNHFIQLVSSRTAPREFDFSGNFFKIIQAMAARRIASSSINWTALAERVPETQRQMYNSLKARSEQYLRRVLSNPETAPKIDFASYKSKIAVPGLVDSFQKQYDAFKVPYPADKLSNEINAQEKQAAEEITAFVAASQGAIRTAEAAIAKWDDVLPYEEMTLEDVKDMFPDQALDPLRKPTFWPHNPEEQLDYKKPADGAAAAH